MLLPPLTIPLLNATGLLLANSTIDAPPRNPVYCFKQRPEGEPQRAKALLLDCFTLALKIVQEHPRPTHPMDFSHDPNKGRKVPTRFIEKTCGFEVNLPEGQPGAWSASFADIAYGANDIDIPCVHDGDHLGGMTKIGPESKLDLYVYGREWEPPEIGTDIGTTAVEDDNEITTA